MSTYRVFVDGVWRPVQLGYWGVDRWRRTGGVSTGTVGRQAYWRAKILAHLAGEPTVTRRVTPADNLTQVLSEMYTQASAAAGVSSPLVKRARLVLADGVYQQFVNVGLFGASTIALEIVGESKDRSKVIIESPAANDATLEWSGATGVIAYVTVKKTNAPVNRGVHGGVTPKGKATELVIFESTVNTTGAAQSLSWEASSGRTLYVADSELIGLPYLHTLYGSGTPGLGTQVIFDNVVSEIKSINDEVADAADVFVHRSGWDSAGVFNFNVGRRDGSSQTPTMRGIIDPNSGIRSSTSALVEFRDPDMTVYPILGANPRMKERWG